MRRLLLVTLVAAAVGVPALRAQSYIERRRAMQDARIAEGIRSGRLTRAEAARLERQQAQLDRQIRRDYRDGGGLSLRERREIGRRQDRLSRQIAREAHDRQHARRW